MTKARVTVFGSMVDDVIADIVCFSAFEGINRELGKLLATGGARACMYLCLSPVFLQLLSQAVASFTIQSYSIPVVHPSMKHL